MVLAVVLDVLGWLPSQRNSREVSKISLFLVSIVPLRLLEPRMVPMSTVSCSVAYCPVDSTSCYCSVGTLLSSAQQVCPHSLDTDRSAARPWVVGCIVEVVVHRFGCNFEFDRIVLADEEGAAGDALQSDVGAGVAMAHLGRCH